MERAKVLLFADDIKISLEVYSSNGSNNSSWLQDDINRVMRWCEDNRLFFNQQKCHIFTAIRNDTSFIETQYTLNDYIIERKDDIRDLGVLIDKRFHFGHHIEQLTKKCRQLVGCIKHFSNGNFTKETQRLLFLAYVRSRLEFSSVIWNPQNDIYKDDIESIQNQFVIYLVDSRRNATSYRLSPYIERCNLVKLQPLETRRKIADSQEILMTSKLTLNLLERTIHTHWDHRQLVYLLSHFLIRNIYVHNQLLDLFA